MCKASESSLRFPDYRLNPINVGRHKRVRRRRILRAATDAIGGDADDAVDAFAAGKKNLQRSAGV